MSPVRGINRWVVLLIVGMHALAGCDAVSPESDPVLVVEGFAETDAPPPVIRLRQSLSMGTPYDESAAAVLDATIRLTTPNETISYEPIPGEPGRYRADGGRALAAGTPVQLAVTWQEEIARSSSRLPERIRIAAVETDIPDRPVEAVLLDSLQLDSLQTGARSAFVYPITVRMWWERSAAAVVPDSLNWVRAQLRPFTEPLPGVIELFFRSEQIMREDRVKADGSRRLWTGVYLVPVDRESDPLPAHSLKVAVIRSDADYARFASSRTAPDRREPVSNVSGGVGLFAGISVDSLTLQIP